VTDWKDVQRRAQIRARVLRRARTDPRFLHVLGRLVREGLMVTNGPVAPHREPIAVKDVLWAGNTEPRLLELLPALLVRQPGMFDGAGSLPADLDQAVGSLRRGKRPAPFRGIPGESLERWLPVAGKRKTLPAKLKSFRLKPEDLRILELLAERLGLSETDVIRRGLRALEAQTPSTAVNLASGGATPTETAPRTAS
jgi:hypothetical protein